MTDPNKDAIDLMETPDFIARMLDEELASIGRIRPALPDIARAIDEAAASISYGGMVRYAGAGTSGRLGVLDSSEVPPTFSNTQFRASIAGGERAITHAVEGAEDETGAGESVGATLGPNDLAIGITASGTTPYVHGFLSAAKQNGARTWLLTCSAAEPTPYIDGIISIPTGPEIVTGSTRLKAGTATKLVLNMISTATMVRMGGTYGSLMVDVSPSNAKLVARAVGIIRQITGCTGDEARQTLEVSGMRPKVAALMRARGLTKDEAHKRLTQCGGSLRKALTI